MRILSRLCLVLACASVLGACESPIIPSREDAYPFATLPRFAGDKSFVIRWPAGTSVRVFVNGGAAPRATVLENAFNSGAGMWENSILFGEFTLAQVSDIREADVVITWSDVVLPLDVSACPVVFGNAATTFCLTTDSKHLLPFPFTSAVTGAAPSDSHVKMLVTVIGSTSADQPRATILVTHELGHVLGIAQHSPNPLDVMFATVTASILTHADQSTVQVLYHTSVDVTP